MRQKENTFQTILDYLARLHGGWAERKEWEGDEEREGKEDAGGQERTLEDA